LKSRYEIADRDPISMFCGLPVTVATLPIFDAVATATRYGMGGSSRRRAMCNTNGVMTRHTMSFTRNAESKPQVKMTVGSR
jgi:hypothetical protein